MGLLCIPPSLQHQGQPLAQLRHSANSWLSNSDWNVTWNPRVGVRKVSGRDKIGVLNATWSGLSAFHLGMVTLFFFLLWVSFFSSGYLVNLGYLIIISLANFRY